MYDDALVAVDPHKAHSTLMVLGPVSRRAVDEAEFPNTVIAPLCALPVAGASGAGPSKAATVPGATWPNGSSKTARKVLDVPAKLAARIRILGQGRKTDRDDAISVSLAALQADGVAPVVADDALVSLRLWCDRRDELVPLRTQAVCRLHRLLTEPPPAGPGGTFPPAKPAPCWRACGPVTKRPRPAAP